RSTSGDRTSPPVTGLPLDRAAHRRHEGRRRLLAREDRIEHFAHDLLLHGLRFLRVVELPAIPKLSRRVEHEEVRGAHGAVRFGDLLALVAKVREVVAFALRAFDHVCEVIFRIALFVVRVNHDELHALSRVIALDGNRPILPRLHVWTVIAPERDREDRFVPERCQRVCLPIDRGQREVWSRGADWESFVLHELHVITGHTHPRGRYRLSPSSSDCAMNQRSPFASVSPASRHKLYHQPAGWSTPVI